MGFKVTVEDAKCIQANAFIQEGIFQEFAIKEDQITFKINLTVLLVSTCMEASMEHNDYHVLIYLRNDFHFWKVHGIMNTSSLLQS